MQGVHKVLIIDDDIHLLSMFASALKAGGFDVQTAVSAKEGLHMLDKEEPDILLVDVMMPMMDGIELVAELERRKLNMNKVVLMSSLSIDVLEKKIDKGKVAAMWFKDDLTVGELVRRLREFG